MYIYPNICMHASMYKDPTWGIRGTKTHIRVFYSNVARCVNTVPLNMCACMSLQGTPGGIRVFVILVAAPE